MSNSSSTARRLRRGATGAALVLFPALLVAEVPIDPATNSTGEIMYRAATEHAGVLTASAVLLLVSGILMAPAAAGILHQARDRGAGLANAGAVLAVLGGFGHAALALFYILSLALAGGDPDQMAAYVERLDGEPVLGFVVFPLILSFGLGVLVLAWAAWRSGQIPLWGPAAVSTVVVAHLALPVTVPAVEVAGLLVLTAVFGWMGIRVLRMTDADWDGVPRTAPSPEPAPA